MDRIVRLAGPSRKQAASKTTGAAGKLAEDLAANHLLHRGLKVLSRNYGVRGGEIDLVCEDSGTIVFVEVRLRSNGNFGGAAASITPRKQQRIILAARHWLSQHGDRNCRFDCVVMDVLEASHIEWIKDAFSAD